MDLVLGSAFLVLGFILPLFVLSYCFLAKRVPLWRRLVVTLATVLLAANFTVWPYLMLKDPFPSYYYESSDQGFRAKEFTKTPGSYRQLQMNYSDYQNGLKGKKVSLYRTFTKNPARFWMWREYLIDERWQLPFKVAVFCPFSEDSPLCEDYPDGPKISF